MIAKWMQECRAYPLQVWGEYALRRDPQYKKLQQKAGYYIEKAEACGRQLAREIRQQHSAPGMRDIAGQMGLQVEDMPPFAMQGYYQFAEFEEPGTIRLSEHLLALAQEMVEEKELFFLHQPLEDHLLAHELFHFLEMENEDLFTRTQQVEVFRLGPLRRTSGIRSLGEIAAMAFAEEILGLDYSPFLMDILLLYPKEPQAAKKLYDEVAAIAAQT